MEQTPEDLFNLPPRVLEQIKKTSIQDYPQHVIEYFGPPSGECHFTLASPLSTTRKWREVLGVVTYVVRLENCDFIWSGEEKLVCRITVLHTRDARFAIEVRGAPADFFCNELTVRIIFGGETTYDSCCTVPSFSVIAFDNGEEEFTGFTRRDIPRSYKTIENSHVYSTCSFQTTPDELERHGLLSHGRQEFKICLQQ